MAEITQVKLPSKFMISPERLVVAQKRVPVDDYDCIPLMIYDRKRGFTIAEPVLTSLGGGAVAMSLGKPFGFVQSSDFVRGAVVDSQRTEQLILAPNPEEDGKWLATLETPKPLTQEDIGLFARGIKFYAQEATAKLFVNL